MYNENEKRNVTVSQKGNAIQSAALNIHQLFPSRTKDECLLELKKNPSVYRTYLNWPDKWKNRFLEFMEGKKSLPLTYDPFFKKLFNPDVYPERLSQLISSIIGTKVTVKCILSNEDSMLPSTTSPVAATATGPIPANDWNTSANPSAAEINFLPFLIVYSPSFYSSA